ncbi:MAG: hypothetical protein ABSB56_06405 [Nitrososphaerales archaeon]|jgi:hypothetical protein
MDLVSELERQGKAGSYIVSNLKAVKSWLSHNGVEFRRRIKVRGVDVAPWTMTRLRAVRPPDSVADH